MSTAAVLARCAATEVDSLQAARDVLAAAGLPEPPGGWDLIVGEAQDETAAVSLP
jgi:hypothetical protein